MKSLNFVTLGLLVIGGLNWGLVGAFQFDLVAALFGGQDALLSRVVYGLVGLSALWQIAALARPGSRADVVRSA
ncbi:DUF378 domain-containing protein [Vulcaniibacterium thermophilum]|jgi:uncharacterized membrane protein YuzA (DUF378 family)|uniref:DUF378 domain-containing protein n=1 Tax=Vulcaniibacterium thermophilum TaxID=1169913 RepID=A0A919D796_9GAMM|nr:DUF378 domain-containing protein [Vulcaniibacterium thermophilum]GHE24690.1 DUF378 domain-containing protein [Vulcaniibacterium thermophilum]